MAGFRIGRGRDNRTSGQQRPGPAQGPGQRQYGGPQQAPYGASRPTPPHAPRQQHGGPPQAPSSGRGGQQWPQAGGGHGEPEYFGDPYGRGQGGQPSGGQGYGHDQGYGQGPAQGHSQGQYGQGGQGYAQGQGAQGQGAPRDPYTAQNNPGHTQAFSIGEDPYSQGGVYHAGQPAAPPTGPRLHWKELLSGIVLRPSPTFLRMRDYPMWGPALIVSFLYGLLAIFGFDGAREDVIDATITTAIPYVLTTGVAITLSAFILGVVTHTVARQLGGDGAWQPTVGLSMLIMTITDAPRLVVAIFAGGDAPFVQILGWITWILAGVLFTNMVNKSHDLPWPKALAASAIQLIALLSIIKLGTI